MPSTTSLRAPTPAWLNAGRLRLYAADDPSAPHYRSRQLRQSLAATPLALVGNLVCSMTVAAVFSTVMPWTWLFGWAFALMAASMLSIPAWLRSQSEHWPPRVSRRALRRAAIHAGVMAVLWSVLPAVFMMQTQRQDVLLVGWIVIAGILCGSGFLLRATPLAGSLFITVLGASAMRAGSDISGASGPALLVLAVTFTSFTLASQWFSSRSFMRRVRAEQEADRQAHVIGLLLRDFSDNSSDVLWETDVHGRATLAHPRLSQLLDVAPEVMLREPLLDLLRRRQHPHAAELLPAGGHGLDALIQRLLAREPFRDLVIALMPAVGQPGDAVWWSITAKPRYDESGRWEGWRGIVADVTQTEHAARQLRHLAHHDPLTGLLNRRRLPEVTLEALHAPGGELPPCAVVCLDIQHFRSINETFGHAAGDAMLIEVALRLKAGVRRGDLVARLGADDFAVVLPGVASADEAEALVARLLATLQQPFVHEGRSLPVQLCNGLAVAPQDGATLETLMQHAGMALNADCGARDGQIMRFRPEMAAEAHRRQRVEARLREALERDGALYVAFQPQIDLKRQEVLGFEALARWHDIELGEVSPAEFIPIAEASGLIVPLGAWVLQEACRHAATWPASLAVSVNVSAVQARSAALLQTVQQTLAVTGLPAARLELEITESVLVEDTPSTLELLRRLQEMGIRIALDDFGTGYSSLAYLRRFPFDTLKIDRAFVAEVMTRRDARAIVRTIVSLAQTLQMQTVAEGVEEAAQAEALQLDGCHAMQGYLVSRPIRAQAIAGFLDQWDEKRRTMLATRKLLESTAEI